ncbi:hypothetical protein [Microbacterium sp.]|uniref:hypothetical protein n=1 Tax=Microbacterium sp. TaxID=51671 RepID=UPI003A8D03F4
MMRRRSSVRTRARPARHGRHGREGRSPVVRPPLPPLQSRDERFDLIVGTAAEFLRSAWEELSDVKIEIADMPLASDPEGIPRWLVDRARQRIVLYRIPIERLSHVRPGDDLRERIVIEGSMFRAAAEYLDRDPWDLGPERFRF